MKIAVPGTRTGRSGFSVSTNCASGSASRARSSARIRRPRHQVPITAKTTPATTIGNQPPSAIFSRLALRKVRSTMPKTAKSGTASGEAPAAAAHVEEGEPGGDRHHAADRDAVGGAEIVGGPEDQHEEDDGDQQAAVDARHVDLPDLCLRGVAHLEPRQIAELDRLAGDRKRAGDDRLRGDDRRERRQARPAGRGPMPGASR